MVLTIDTASDNLIEVTLSGPGGTKTKQLTAPRRQAEKLLPLIVKLLSSQGVAWRQIKLVQVKNEGGSFTSLRIGVLTANALAYALGVPAESVANEDVFVFAGGQAVKPRYQTEPNIGRQRGGTC